MSAIDVHTVRWPSEGEKLAQLRRQDAPRLLLVAPGEQPPDIQGCLEDWARMPVSSADLEVRRSTLMRRAAEPDGVGAGPGAPRAVPSLDADGVLRFGGEWVAIPPVETRLLNLMLERFGGVVSRDALTKAGWPGKDADRNVLDVHILRLRRRLDEVGLVIRTVRSRGYLLEPAKPASPSASVHAPAASV